VKYKSCYNISNDPYWIQTHDLALTGPVLLLDQSSYWSRALTGLTVFTKVFICSFYFRYESGVSGSKWRFTNYHHINYTLHHYNC